MSDPGADVEPEATSSPSPRAARGFKDFIRSSPWLVISVGAHVVAFALLGLFYVTKDTASDVEPPVIVTIRGPEPLVVPEFVPPPPQSDRNVIPDNVEQAVAEDENKVPDPTLDVTQEPSGLDGADDVGDTLSGSTSMGTGTVGERGGGGPSPFPGPGEKTKRSRRGTPDGGSQATEKAVLDGMRWLLRHQNKDGSWTTHGFADHCQANSKCQNVSEHMDDRFDEGLTGLAVLAFLGAGYGPDSKQFVRELGDPAKKYRIGDSLKRALQWLVKRQKPDGSFTESGPFMYNEAICALALTEAYGRGRQSRMWRKPAEEALAFLTKAQRQSPADPSKLWGWRYESRVDIEAKRAEYASPDAYAQQLHDSDTSVTGWVAMAFKSAATARLALPKTSVAGALDFSTWIATDTGLSGYRLPEQAGEPVEGQFANYTYHAASMAAVNACIKAFLARDPTDPYFRKAADLMILDLPRSGTGDDLAVDYYYWYYATLALNQIDGPDAPKKTGKHWQTWNAALTKALLGLQDQDDTACSHGGWIVADRWAHEASPIYSTAINVLTLEVYYRYDNAFR